LGAIGFAGWRVYQLQAVTGSQHSTSSKNPSVTRAEQLASHPSIQAASDFVAAVSDKLRHSFIVESKTDAPAAGHIALESPAISFEWQTPGYPFIVQSVTNATLKIHYSAYNDDGLQKINSIVTAGLAAEKLEVVPDSAKPLISYIGSTRYYANEAMVCQFDNRLLNSGRLSGVFYEEGSITLACDTTSDFASISVAMAPLLTAVDPGSVSLASTQVYTKPVVKNSQTPGYRIALFIPLEGTQSDSPIFSGGVFYEKANTWHFYDLHTDLNYPRCNALATTEARFAYIGTTCYETDNSKGFIKYA